MPDWVIEPMNRSHQRREFSCGQPTLDTFIHSLVSQYQKRKLGQTYVAVREGEKRVYGYYTLAASAVTIQDLPKDLARKLPKHPVPVVLLGRLAVDRAAQGQGLGRKLLVDALHRCLSLSDSLGIQAVEVDAIGE